MGMFDHVSFQAENNFLQRFYKKIQNLDITKVDFQTKSLTCDLNLYVINNSNQLTLNGIFLKDFNGTFEIYSYKDDYWVNILVTIENGMLTKTKLEYMAYHSNKWTFKFHKPEEDIPYSSIVYLRRIIDECEE